MTEFLHKLRNLFRLRDKERDFAEELEFHLAEEAEELSGSASAARRSVGNLTQVQEEARAAWTFAWVEQFFQDCRYGFRTIAANKTFSALAILSLALGIGANTALYSFMDALLLSSLPVSNPSSLAILNWTTPTGSRDSVMRSMSGSTWRESNGAMGSGIFPYPAFELIRDNSSQFFSSVFAYYPTRNVHVSIRNQGEQANGEYVSGDYFHALGVNPSSGRLLQQADDIPGAPPVAVLSHSFAQSHFADLSTAPGQTILVNNIAFGVVGVAPPGFYGVDPAVAPDFYVPLRSSLVLKQRFGASEPAVYLAKNYYWLEMMVRLRPGVTHAQAQAALAPMFHQWVESTATNDKQRASLPQLLVREGATGLNTLRRQYAKPLYVLLGMVTLILAIACANIANLLLARATARKKEMAVRLSIGAGRLRLIRQLLTESLLLATCGGLLGVLFAIWGIRFLSLLIAYGRENFMLRPELNWQVLLAALALSLLTGLLFGIAPALQSTRVDVMPALKDARAGDLTSRGFARPTLSQVLVVTQIGLSLLLLAGAGLFVRSLQNLQSIQLGFNSEDVLLFRLNARQAGHQDASIVSFYTDLQNRFAAIPGVRAVSAADAAILGDGTSSGPFLPPGVEAKPGKNPHILTTGPGYFETMQIPILLGRGIEERDRAGAPVVAVVSETYAQTYLAGRNPIGQKLVLQRRAPEPQVEAAIVGVVAKSRYGNLKGDFPATVFLSYRQSAYHPVDEMTFLLRTAGDPYAVLPMVREIVRQADARVPITAIGTQKLRIEQMVLQEIILARLCTVFALLALLISCIGLYGTMAYTVARRTSEIGIRMALGARRGDMIWMILRQVLALGLIGLLIGIGTARGASQLIESFLYDIKPNSPMAIATASAILLAAIVLAGYVPARRASRIDPITTVRHE